MTNNDILEMKINEARIDIKQLWTAVNALRGRTARIENHTEIDELKLPKDNIKLFFGDALRQIMNSKNGGKLMTRSAWNNKDIHVFLSDDGGSMAPYLAVRTINGEFAVWMPNHNEMLAMDWMVIE